MLPAYLILLLKPDLKKNIFIIALFLAVSSSFRAQNAHDSLNFTASVWSKHLLLTRFDKQLNTYNLNSLFTYGQKSGSLFMGVTENFNSTLVRSTLDNIKDEHYFSLFGEYNVYDNLKMGMLANNNILSDDRKLALNQASVSNVSMFLKFSPLGKIYATPFYGYENNNQIGEDDYGQFYGFEGFIDSLPLNDFNIFSIVKFLNEDISPRKNFLKLINFSLTNEMSGTFKNIFNWYYLQNRKDFYYTADSVIRRTFSVANNIQSRIETNYYAEDRFLAPDIYKDFTLGINARTSWRVIDRDTRYRLLSDISTSVFDLKVEEFKIDLESFVEYRSTAFDGLLKLNYSERNEKHTAKKFEETNIFMKDERLKTYEERNSQEAQKNNITDRIYVSFTGSLKLSNRDRLFLSLFHNKLTYDTPGENNFDDRDELLSIFRIYYLHNMTPCFDTFISLEGSLNHIVYIYSERSSNNNISRFLKLGTGGNYQSGMLTSKNLFEVSANYITYDFEDTDPNFRSYSYRQLAYQDSTTIRLGSHISVALLGTIKFSEQGNFNWAKFSGKPVRILNEYNFEPKLFYSYQGLTFGAGIRYLLLKTYSFNNNIKEPESGYRSVGPVTEFSTLVNGRLNIMVTGWYEFITSEKNIHRKMANLNIQINWIL